MSRIRTRREALRVEFSQHHLAKLTGIPQTKISLIERGLVESSLHEKERLANALQCKVVELWPECEEICQQ